MMFFKRKKPGKPDPDKKPTGLPARKTRPQEPHEQIEPNPPPTSAADSGNDDERSTLRLGGQAFSSMFDMTPAPDWARSEAGFRPVPSWAQPPPDDESAWRIELKTAVNSDKPIRLLVLGDAVLGRTAESDVSMDEYEAVSKGVSRRHAMLRPTPNQLYLIELGSTNGTLLNGLILGPGMARPLRNDDVISLGDLRLTVHLFGAPSERPNVSVVDMYVPDVLEKRDRDSRPNERGDSSKTGKTMTPPPEKLV